MAASMRNLFSQCSRFQSAIARNNYWSKASLSTFYRSQQRIGTAEQDDATSQSSSEITDSLKDPDYFKVKDLVSLQDLFDARVHLGHKDGLINPHMKKYIFGIRQNQCIIDLDQTAGLLKEALNFTAHVAHRGGIILFINRMPQFTFQMEQLAKDCGEYAHTRLWQGGCFTNAPIQYGPGTRLPDLLVFFHTLTNTFTEHLAVTDAAKMNIPTVGVVDTNCNPNLITYPIPGNDDSPSAMELYCRLFKTAVLKGKAKRNDTDV
ncbi:28S ribosomal protein S2, mitochondrial-like [Patiria miniata]|uniref:Small ribosomal subunit protein uS2m n=1 Tax=Patiria miniata TaxID=46514 RepID=A0A914AIE3_PATMI|nr:28S ribosomal protein S2, mitochondrial-like [Patiria miniata]